MAAKLVPEGALIEFPEGTPDTLMYKADGPAQWGRFCERFNVMGGGEGGAGAAPTEAFAMMMMSMQENVEGAPMVGCGGYRGGCLHEAEMFNWKDQNMDEWGEAHVAGLRVGLEGRASVLVRDGIPIITVEHLGMAGVSVPGFVRQRIQAEIDRQLAKAYNLPIAFDTLELEEGQGSATGTIR